jgi:hypothetical protein
MVRVSLRRVGGSVIKKAALPATMAELLEVATRKLGLDSPAARVFGADGGEFDHDDLELIEKDDLLYISCGEEFFMSPVAERLDPVDVLDQPELLIKMPAEWVLSHQALLLQVLKRHGSTHIVQAAALRAIKQLGATWLEKHALSCRSPTTLARQARYGCDAVSKWSCDSKCQSQCTIVMERLADRDEPGGAWAINAFQVRIAALEVVAEVGGLFGSFKHIGTFESVILNDDHPAVRAAALAALHSFIRAQWHTLARSNLAGRWLPIVMSRLVDTGPGVRLAALELLASLPASLLQMNAPALRTPLLAPDWDADEEEEGGEGGEVLERRRQQRATARRAVLDLLHDHRLFDWLDDELIRYVGRSLCTAPRALAGLSRCSRRLHVTLREQLSAMQASLFVAMRSSDVSKAVSEGFLHLWSANFRDQILSHADCVLLALAFPCLPHLKCLRFIQVTFRAAALPALLTSIVDVAEETSLASRLETLMLRECQFATSGHAAPVDQVMVDHASPVNHCQAQAMTTLAQSLPLLTGLTYLDLKGSGEATDVISACERVNKERLELASRSEHRNGSTSKSAGDRWYTPQWSWIWQCSSCESPRVLSQCGSELNCSRGKASCTSLSVHHEEITPEHYGGVELSCDGAAEDEDADE